MAFENAQLRQQQRFLIAGMQRSGTTVTQRVIAGHPQVGMTEAEISVEPFFEPGYSGFTFGNESYGDRAAAYPALFDAVARIRTVPDTRTHGLKVAIGDHRSSLVLGNALREYLPEVKLIVTIRDDLVAQFGSFVRARKTGTWHIQSSSDRRATEMIRIDPSEFSEYATRCLDAIDQLRFYTKYFDVFEVSYERDILDGTDWSDVFQFLGIDPIPVTWNTMAKVTPKPEAYIENYAETCEALQEIKVGRVFDPRECAENALAASAQKDREYQAIRRAELFLKRGDKDTASRLAYDVLERESLPESTVIRSALILGNHSAPNGADLTRKAIEAAARRIGVDVQTLFDQAELSSEIIDQLLLVTSKMPPYDVLDVATCARDCMQHRLTASVTCKLLRSRSDLTDRQLNWALSLLVNALHRIGDRELSLAAVRDAEENYRDHGLVTRFRDDLGS